MNHLLNVTIHNSLWTIEEKPFLPSIEVLTDSILEHPLANVLVIQLPASIGAELDWTIQAELARKVEAANKYVLWEMDFDFSTSQIDPHDSAAFLAYTIALEEFSKLYREFGSITLGICLYRGSIDLSNSILWNEKIEEHFIEFLHEYSFFQKNSIDKYFIDLFNMKLFVDYVHRLCSYLPETLLPFCFFDTTQALSQAACAQLLSKKRFDYIQLGVSGSALPLGSLIWNQKDDTRVSWHAYPFGDQQIKRKAVCLPKDEMNNSYEILQLFDFLFSELLSKKVPFRIIPEENLTDEWQDVDTIFVIEKALSSQGKRKLQGFCATGGEVVILGKQLTLPCEKSFEDYCKTLPNL